MSTTVVGNKSLRFVLKTFAVIRRITGAIASGFQRAAWLAREFNRIRKMKPKKRRTTKKRSIKRSGWRPS